MFLLLNIDGFLKVFMLLPEIIVIFLYTELLRPTGTHFFQVGHPFFPRRSRCRSSIRFIRWRHNLKISLHAKFQPNRTTGSGDMALKSSWLLQVQVVKMWKVAKFKVSYLLNQWSDLAEILHAGIFSDYATTLWSHFALYLCSIWS